MEASLEDPKLNNTYQLNDKDFKVTVPLAGCLHGLKEKHNSIAKVHQERFEHVQSEELCLARGNMLSLVELVQALESYSSHLEPSFVRVTLPPPSSNGTVAPNFDLSPSYVTALDDEFSRVYNEYMRRVAMIKAISEEVVNLWAELGTPQAQTEASIVKHYRESPEQLGLHENDIENLQKRRDRLMEEKRGRERKLKELKTTVEGLWIRLGVEDSDRKRFVSGNRGCGLRAINEFEAELDRLNELKRQNLHLFIEDARYKLQDLWDGLYFSEEEMLEFTPAFSDVPSDALLSAHEAEIERLDALKEQRAPTLELIDKYRSLIHDRDELAASSQDASRLLAKSSKGEKRDPTRLLREEKMRKRIAKDLPKVEVELRKTLEKWEDEYGRPFLVHGMRYLDELAVAAGRTLPPRSKTPSGPRTTTKAIKSAPPVGSSRAGSAIRAAPPSRSDTKTPAGTLRRNPIANPITTASRLSPSKIPARVPLGHMQHGNNSPERRVPPESVYDTNTMRKMGPPARVPPPKMRDLFVPPATTPGEDDDAENRRFARSASSNGTGCVRHITPEDVYDDRERMSYIKTSSVPHPDRDTRLDRDIHQIHRELQISRRVDAGYQQQDRFISPAEIRHISATSTVTTTASGSENWETFDDASEPEVDVSDAYYAKMRAARTVKRYTPDGGHTPPRGAPGKKFKSIHGAGGGRPHQPVVEEGNGPLVAASEAGWTDEDAF